jgi:hypothetical protein
MSARGRVYRALAVVFDVLAVTVAIAWRLGRS